jgi:hypothetical protein
LDFKGKIEVTIEFSALSRICVATGLYFVSMFENEHYEVDVLGINEIVYDIDPNNGIDTFYVIASVIYSVESV